MARTGPRRRAVRRRKATPRSGGRPPVVLLGGVTTLVIVAIIVWGITSGRDPGEPAPGDAGTVSTLLEVDTSLPASVGLLPPGSLAPDFSWRTGEGTSHSLASLRGKRVVLLEFLATWCPHCQNQAPIITSLYQQYRQRGLEAFGVSASPLGMDGRSPSSPEDLARFAQRFGAGFPLIYDPSSAAGRHYGVRVFPATLLIDREGIVRFSHGGEVAEAELAAVIEPALR